MCKHAKHTSTLPCWCSGQGGVDQCCRPSNRKAISQVRLAVTKSLAQACRVYSDTHCGCCISLLALTCSICTTRGMYVGRVALACRSIALCVQCVDGRAHRLRPWHMTGSTDAWQEHCKAPSSMTTLTCCMFMTSSARMSCVLLLGHTGPEKQRLPASYAASMQLMRSMRCSRRVCLQCEER